MASSHDAANDRGERVFFVGRVQGVFFRRTTQELARRFPSLVGSVRNLTDGRVQIDAIDTADGDAIDRLIAALRDHFGENIERVDRQPLPADEAPPSNRDGGIEVGPTCDPPD